MGSPQRLVDMKEKTEDFVLTLKPHHGLGVGDRLIIRGITDVTNANGSWIISAVTDTTVILRPRVGIIKYLKSLFIKFIEFLKKT